MAHTHTLLWSSFQVCGGYLCIFQCRCIFFFLLEGRRTSGWSSAPFTFYLSSCWRRSCRERTSVMNQAPAGSCDPTRRGRTPLRRRNHRPRGPNHPPLSPNLQGNPYPGAAAVALLALTGVIDQARSSKVGCWCEAVTKWGRLGDPGENDVRKIVPRQPRAILRIRYSSYGHPTACAPTHTPHTHCTARTPIPATCHNLGTEDRARRPNALPRGWANGALGRPQGSPPP